jgi:hypothetical protein
MKQELDLKQQATQAIEITDFLPIHAIDPIDYDLCGTQSWSHAGSWVVIRNQRARSKKCYRRDVSRLRLSPAPTARQPRLPGSSFPYRSEYNDHRTHSSLGDQTPTEFRLGLKTNEDPEDASKRVA